MIYYVLLMLGAYSASMAAVWLYRVITDGRLYYYLSILSASLKARAAHTSAHRKPANGNRLPWGW